ncbi:hypothetical protein P1J78_21365 [Psychromarinibacter sp. C21-152]|uniref:Tat pathway signal sequence domain protein n=1 Tax=Psychromarinibacter sediminicola TaxID=3033385 RepID=A0AAE3NYZ5_9RHOB|nr:hypothetical protein [Psychromarinibacter sediminicola]MDF0603287.1 hypothetical protein [Psychromarinibacter sediminicola]
MRAPRLRLACLATALGFGTLAGQALAQEAEEPASTALFVELNTLSPLEGGCRLTFMATNALGTDVEQLVLETVLMTTEGKVDRLTLFDLRELPANRPRVRQFDVSGLACDALGRVLINGIDTCTGEGLDREACSDRLDLSTRAGVEVIG